MGINARELFYRSYIKRDASARLQLISEFSPREILDAAWGSYCEFGNCDRMDHGFDLARESEEYHKEYHD